MIQPKEVNTWFNIASTHEAPMIFNRWAALAAMGHVTKNKTFITFMGRTLHPNMYVIFSGSPATKKSTVLNYMLGMCEGIKHLPTNMTSAQFKQELADAGKEDLTSLDLDNICALTLDNIGAGQPDVLVSIIHHELQGTFTEPSSVMPLLRDLWEGGEREISVRTSRKSHILKNPLLNISSALNADQLDSIFPSGILMENISRLVFVAGEPSGIKKNPLTVRKNDLNFVNDMRDLLSRASKLEGEFSISEDAAELYDAILNLEVQSNIISDARLTFFLERRGIHLIKMCMNQALLNERLNITLDDVKYCHTLLAFTEAKMTEALGFYGRAKEAKGMQAILKFLGDCATGVPMASIYAATSQLFTSMEAMKVSLSALTHASKVIEVTKHEPVSDTTIVEYLIAPNDIIRWKSQFGITVFPETLEEWHAIS